MFGLVGVHGPAPGMVNSKDGRRPVVVLAGGLNGGAPRRTENELETDGISQEHTEKEVARTC
jgi:hypothetical protein